NPSLPIVLALERDPEVQRLFATPGLPAAELERGLARIQRSGVLPLVAARAREEMERAMAAIELLPPSPAPAALHSLSPTMGERPAWRLPQPGPFVDFAPPAAEEGGACRGTATAAR